LAHGGARAGAGRPRKPSPVDSAPPDVYRWYVARCAHGMTELADREIRLAGFTVFAPTIFKPAIAARRDAAGVIRPGKPDRVEWLFVRYCIVSLNLARPTSCPADPSAPPYWRDVLACDGVERIISGYRDGTPGAPIAVPDAAIDWVRGLLGPNDCIDGGVHHHHAEPIARGTRLRLLDGSMPDRVGVCSMSDGERVVLLMNLFGRVVPVSVAQSAVEAV
jgi:transcription antitermination factor NusG